MSSFGDRNIKTRMQEELDNICYDYYGCEIYDLTPEQKLQFTMRVLEVVRYVNGYITIWDDNDENAYPLKD